MKEAKPLEGKLKEFMDSATEGAVLVSFGSALKPEQMPPEKIQVFIDTFKNLLIQFHREIKQVIKNIVKNLAI